MRPIRLYACEDCGRVVPRPRRTDRPKLCGPCGIARATENARRLAAMGQAIRTARSRQRVTTGG